MENKNNYECEEMNRDFELKQEQFKILKTDISAFVDEFWEKQFENEKALLNEYDFYVYEKLKIIEENKLWGFSGYKTFKKFVIKTYSKGFYEIYLREKCKAQQS